MNRFVLAFLAGVAPAFGQDICRAPPPPGTGLNAQGAGYVHFMQSGLYVFHGVKRIDGMVRYQTANTYAPILAISSKPEWTRPDGVREPIPTTSLYPAQ